MATVAELQTERDALAALIAACVAKQTATAGVTYYMQGATQITREGARGLSQLRADLRELDRLIASKSRGGRITLAGLGGVSGSSR